jgi:hypothetical protein
MNNQPARLLTSQPTRFALTHHAAPAAAWPLRWLAGTKN